LLFFGRLCWTAFDPPCLPGRTDAKGKTPRVVRRRFRPPARACALSYSYGGTSILVCSALAAKSPKTPFGGLTPASAKTPNVAAEQKRKIAKLPNCQVARQPSCPRRPYSSQMQVESRRLDTTDICLAFGHGRQLSLMSGALDTTDNCPSCPVQEGFGKIGSSDICPQCHAPKLRQSRQHAKDAATIFGRKIHQIGHYIKPRVTSAWACSHMGR